MRTSRPARSVRSLRSLRSLGATAALSALGLALAPASLGGCARVTGLDDFHTRAGTSESAATASDFFGLKLAMLAMKPHSGHLIEYRVVDANNYVQSRGVVKDVTNLDIVLHAKRVIPRQNGPYRLDFYADVNASGGFDGLGSVVSNDHAWRIEPLIEDPATLRSDDTVVVNFQHSTTFTNIDQYPSGTPNKAQDTGLGARVRLQGLEPYLGKTLEVRVADKQSGHVVALFRHPAIAAAIEDAVVPGCVDVSTEYDIDVYVDANGNGTYDDPRAGGDKGWRASTTSGETGLEVLFDVGSADVGPGNVDVGEP